MTDRSRLRRAAMLVMVWAAWQQPQPAAQELTCRVMAAERAEKVGGGFFTYRASDPQKETGVVLLVELSFPPTQKSVSSVDLALQYKGQGGEGRAVSAGFDSLPNKDDVLDTDITWILHATSAYKIPLDDPGFDGKTGTELLRFLFIVPNLADAGILLYQGRPCTDTLALPTRRP